MNENGVVKEYEFNKLLIHKIDSIIDNCIRDCYHKYFNKFDYICAYDIQLTIIGNNELVNLTIADEGMKLYESKTN